MTAMANTDANESVNQCSHIEYELIEIHDLDSINELLVTQFFRNEPLGKKLGANAETDVSPWISEVTKPIINQGVSIIPIIITSYYRWRKIPEAVLDLFAENIIFYL